MARKKVKLSYISDKSARKATFKKRKTGIIKKVNELTILCDLQACAVITDPVDSQNTEIWPDLEGAKEVIEKCQNSSFKDESKNVNQESLLKKSIAKAKDQLKKQNEENREKEMTIAMFEFMKEKNVPEHLTAKELEEFEKLIDKKVKELDEKIAALS